MEDELMGLVSQLATWIGDVAPEVWAIMLKQAMVQGWKNVFGAVIALVSLIVSIVAMVKNWENHDIDGGFCFLIMFGILAGAGVFITCSLAAIGRLVNPAYYALLNIRNIFR